MISHRYGLLGCSVVSVGAQALSLLFGGGDRGGAFRQKVTQARLHGNEETDDICWFASSTTMNPKLSQQVVDHEQVNEGRRFAAAGTALRARGAIGQNKARAHDLAR
jgi:hypothetical protein